MDARQSPAVDQRASRKKQAPDQEAIKRYGPESYTWDQMKGDSVQVIFQNGDFNSGKLVWVDKYSIGVLWNDAKYEAPVAIVFKSGIQEVRPA